MHKKNKSTAWEKTPTGIPGFDQLTGGGLPSRRTTLLLGGPGSGKTVFALQTLAAAARRGQRGIFISFSESPHHLLQNAASFGWELEKLEKERLVFLDPRERAGSLKPGHFDLAGMLAGLQVVARETGATLVAFDSFDVLLRLLNEQPAELQETFRLRDWLCENELTVLITASLGEDAPCAAQRRALLQSVVDCSINLEFRVTEHTASRHLRVVKYRGSGHLENEVPFRIGPAGIELLLPRSLEQAQLPDAGAALQSEIAQARKEMTERVQALDRFLEMKQAELDFLMERKSAPARRPPAGKPRAASKTLAGRLPAGGAQASTSARR